MVSHRMIVSIAPHATETLLLSSPKSAATYEKINRVALIAKIVIKIPVMISYLYLILPVLRKVCQGNQRSA